MRSPFVLLLLTLALVGLPARSAAAAEWTVETAANQFGSARQDYRYTINPGGHLEDGIVVVNPGTTPLRLALMAADGRLGGWVHLDRTDVTVPPGASVEVPFSIALPGDAAPGDYVGGIVTSDLNQRVGIPIRLRVGGALKPSLAVENLRVQYSGTPNPLGKGDATVTYTIHNTGNAILSARQAVSVSGPFGRWAVDAGRIADSPPLLPGDTLKASATLHGVTPALRLEANVTLVPLLTDAAGSTAPLATTDASGHAWTIPWSLLVSIFALSGIAAAAGLALRPRRRRRALAAAPR